MRLTVELRKSIAKQLVESLMPIAYVHERNKADLDELESLVEPSVPKHILAMYKESPEYFKCTDVVYLTMQTKRPDGRNMYYVVTLRKKYPHPCQYIDIDESPSMAARREEVDLYHEQRALLSDRIRAALASCTTTKQLLEILPEAAPFIPNDDVKSILPISAYEELRRDIERIKQGAVNGAHSRS